VNLIPSQDGNLRSAMVKIPSSKVLKLPLKLLFPTEISSSINHTLTSSSTNDKFNEYEQISRQPAYKQTVLKSLSKSN
jgi:hypothetical protein